MQKLSSYLDTKLQDKTKLLHRLTMSIRMQLPAELTSHCWVANIENRTLTIVTDNPSQASLIRFQQHEILKQLNQELGLSLREYLNQLKIKIRKATGGRKLEPPTYTISDDGARHIQACAEHVDDPALKEALQHLATRKTDV